MGIMTKPTENGWYWYREGPGVRWRMTEHYNGRMYATWISDGQSFDVAEKGGEWWGPITPPAAPTSEAPTGKSRQDPLLNWLPY
jgi:hypothetical protein